MANTVRVRRVTVALATPSRATAPPHAWAVGPFRAVGSQIVASLGRPVRITGLNWFGLETCTFAPHGLWARDWQALLDQIVRLHYNTIRLPFSEQLLDPHSMPTGINYTLNPDLRGLSGLQVMDRIIAGAGARGLKVILDQHRERCGNGTETALWYTAAYPQSRWLASWRFLALRYAANPAVLGADLHNEPHGHATWGDGNPATDWRLAAERGGNAVLAIAPRWLIIVEGIERVGEDWYWWGGNLSLAGRYPVRLDRPGRLVYEAHDYGPGVAPQGWFHDPRFPHNLPAIWQRHWAYLPAARIAPVFVGEFGGQSFGDDPEGLWQRTLVTYLRVHRIGYTYWALNPDSGDTGGLLQADWHSVDSSKQAVLATTQAPLLAPPMGRMDLPAVDNGTRGIPLPRAPAASSPGGASPTSPGPMPPATPAFTPPLGVTIGATTARTLPVAPRGAARLGLVMTTHAPLVGAIVDVEIDDAHGAKVYQTWRTPVTLAAGRVRRLAVTWTVAAGQSRGTYTVKAGVFGAGWSRLYAWNDAVAALAVSAAPRRVPGAGAPPHVIAHPAPPRPPRAISEPTASARPPAILPHPRAGRALGRTSQSAGQPIAPLATVIVRVAGLRLHSSPRLDAPIYALLNAGTTLHGDRVTPHWMHVTVVGSALSGWILRARVTVRTPVLAAANPVTRHAAAGAAHRKRSTPAGPGTAPSHRPGAARMSTPPARAIAEATRSVSSVRGPARLLVPRHVHARVPPAGGTSASPSQSTGIASAPSTTVTVRVEGLRLRSGPRLDAPIDALLNAGTTLHGDRVTPHWMHVTVVGSALSGWVFRAYVTRRHD